MQHKVSKMAEGEVLNKDNVDENKDSNIKNIIENGHENEPDFSDPEDFIDEITDEGKTIYLSCNFHFY